jgi:hypothetical protein
MQSHTPDLYIWQGRPSGGGRETLWTGQDQLLQFEMKPNIATLFVTVTVKSCNFVILL